MEVELSGAAVVVLAKRAVEDAVTLAAEIPVTCTAVPVAATPAPVAFAVPIVLFANGAKEEVVVELKVIVVALLMDVVSSVAKTDCDVAVASSAEVVVSGEASHHQGRSGVVVLTTDELKITVEILSDVVVVGGYAVLPSTLDGKGRLVMLVKNVFFVADVFGNEVIGDVVASCLGKTAAWAEPSAKAIVLRR